MNSILLRVAALKTDKTKIKIPPCCLSSNICEYHMCNSDRAAAYTTCHAQHGYLLKYEAFGFTNAQ